MSQKNQGFTLSLQKIHFQKKYRWEVGGVGRDQILIHLPSPTLKLEGFPVAKVVSTLTVQCVFNSMTTISNQHFFNWILLQIVNHFFKSKLAVGSSFDIALQNQHSIKYSLFRNKFQQNLAPYRNQSINLHYRSLEYVLCETNFYGEVFPNRHMVYFQQ